MGRKDFQADFESLRGIISENSDLSCVSIKKGADYGQVDIRLKYPSKRAVSVTALCSDLSGYPKSPDWFVFAEDCEDAKACSALELLQPSGHSLSAVADMVVHALATALNIALPRIAQRPPTTSSSSAPIAPSAAEDHDGDDDEDMLAGSRGDEFGGDEDSDIDAYPEDASPGVGLNSFF
ncbi:hypothetical protein HDU93_001876, partial [Gonapodya sp. JEL0774]